VVEEGSGRFLSCSKGIREEKRVAAGETGSAQNRAPVWSEQVQ
jgi:hypothetical protein